MTSEPLTIGPVATTRRSRGWRIVIRVLIGAGIVALYAQAWIKTEISVSALVTGWHGMLDIIKRSVPPSTDVLGDALRQSVVTFDTALWGATFGVFLSLLLTPFAARNIAPNRFMYEFARVIIGIARSIPDLIFALIFVTAVGLGPFPGVLALTVGTVGTLGKLFAEAIEDMDMGPVDALRVAGASKTQVFLHAVMPGVLPTFVSLVLYRLDYNVRSGLVLGFVGAGGIGFMIFNSMQLFQYQQVFTELLVVLAMVLIVERLSTVLRGRIV